MPAQYEAIKRSELSRGASLAKAKQIAAATYNKQHPGHSLAKWRRQHGETSRKKKRSPSPAELEKLKQHYHMH